MSHLLLSDFTTPRLPEDLDLQLLHDAQACLQCQERHDVATTTEKQAWECLSQTYGVLLRRWLLDRHVAVADVDDCLQEVWTEVVKKLLTFVSDGTQRGFCCWLH